MKHFPSAAAYRLPTALLLLAAFTLAACSSGTDATNIRTGPQATHPVSSAAPTRTQRHRTSRAEAVNQTNTMFDKYCLSGRSNAAIERAVRRSGAFNPAKEITTTNARIVYYLRADGTRGGITLIYSHTGGLRCAVSVETSRAILYSNGRITRPRP